jgi:hypothetical protein
LRKPLLHSSLLQKKSVAKSPRRPVSRYRNCILLADPFRKDAQAHGDVQRRESMKKL